MASANDAAYAIAETAGGSLDGFVAAEQETATRLGMKDSTFADPAGLDDEASFNGGPRMSAFDIAIATRNALAVPEIAKWGATRDYEFVDPTGLDAVAHEPQPDAAGRHPRLRGATGFKTGFTDRAGHTLMATATRNGRSLIAVILNTYDIYGWAGQAARPGLRHAERKRHRRAPAQGRGESVRGSRRRATGVPRRGTRHRGRGADANDSDRDADDARPRWHRPTTSATTSTIAAPTTVDEPSSVVDGDAIVSAASGRRRQRRRRTRRRCPGLIVVLVVLLVAAFLLRRRAVRRQRARRIAQQRHRAAKMRSGGLPVVDGRFGPDARRADRVTRAHPAHRRRALSPGEHSRPSGGGARAATMAGCGSW